MSTASGGGLRTTIGHTLGVQVYKSERGEGGGGVNGSYPSGF